MTQHQFEEVPHARARGPWRCSNCHLVTFDKRVSPSCPGRMAREVAEALDTTTGVPSLGAAIRAAVGGAVPSAEELQRCLIGTATPQSQASQTRRVRVTMFLEVEVLKARAKNEEVQTFTQQAIEQWIDAELDRHEEAGAADLTGVRLLDAFNISTAVVKTEGP